MIIYLDRHNGYLDVKKRIKPHALQRGDVYRVIKTVKDTPENFADILRWADVAGKVDCRASLAMTGWAHDL